MPVLHPLVELLVSLLIVVGALFVFVGSFGLVKLTNFMARLHGPSKATTLGLGGCLLASIIHAWELERALSVQEILVTFFLFITAPVTAHFLAKAYLHSESQATEDLPPTGEPSGWSTFEPLQRE